ncbi:MAG: alpha/beta fold hydrolase [Pirellulaceae bacterium]|jgi:pimeloyl-ACP methyl ester carboxylesterase|nr:alpha/beta fold hydrolase [Pirellulaceae bacterium]MDP7017390.1 alpha/beta fold hydrolase [Pirellulaceae bacterium]
MNSALFAWCCTAVLATVGQGPAENRPQNQPPNVRANEAALRQLEFVVKLPNWKWKTMGGKQFWTDEAVFRDWRIQRNVLTGHCRLLDPANVRFAWGSYKHCQAELTRAKAKFRLAPVDGKVVVVLHGILRSRNSMSSLCKHLKDDGGFTVVNVSYASSRAELSHHAVALARIVKNLPDAKEINIVGHSMGNLVVRHYWADQSKPGRRPDPRIKRIVMLAPPNHSPRLAQFFRDNALFKLLWGASGKQMANWPELEKRLGTPSVQFGIVAGRGNGVVSNPILDDEQDLVVTVEETKLDGAHDFAVMPTTHSQIMKDRATQEAVVRFFEHGYFFSAAERQPLPITQQPKPAKQP